MNFKGVLLGVMGLAASLSASAQSIDFGSFVLDFTNTSGFAAPTADISGATGLVNLSFAMTGAIHLAVNDDVDFAEFALPSFTITAKQPGFKLQGPVAGLLGNLVFSEFGESQSFASLDGKVSINGQAAVAVGGDMTRTVTSSAPGVFTGGYYSATANAPIGEFTSLSFSDGHLDLSVFGTGAILAQPQNQLRVSFFTTPAPVPLPTAVWLLGSALSGLGFLRRRES